METPTKTTLEVGDLIYAIQYRSISRIYKITRVTAKRAFADVDGRFEVQFVRSIEPGEHIKCIGADSYSPSYFLETDELKAKYKRAALTNTVVLQLKNLNLTNLTDERLEQLNKTLSEFGVQ